MLEKKKALSFPWWLEAAAVLMLLTMAGIEYTHGQWFFAAIFGAVGVAFGVSMATRLMTGDKHGGA